MTGVLAMVPARDQPAVVELSSSTSFARAQGGAILGDVTRRHPRLWCTARPAARPRGPHTVYEADSVDPHDPQPVVKLPFQHGYKLGTLDHARTLFRSALGLTAVEWDEETAP